MQYSPEIKERVLELHRLINLHSHNYHSLDAPEILDQEYDALFNELLDLESKYEELRYSYSPSQRVGAKPLEGFQKVEHLAPMLSLDNAFNNEDMLDFNKRILDRLLGEEHVSYSCEPKLDGIAVNLSYRKGNLEIATTRGDGKVGEDITHNIKTLNSIPLSFLDKEIGFPEFIEIRGEAFIAKEDLKASFLLINLKEKIPSFMLDKEMFLGTINERFKYKDLEIISMSLPSSGGILIGQMLKSIEDYDIKSFGHNSVEAIQLMVELERRAYADRSHFMGDPDFMNLPVYELIDKKYVNDRMKNFSWDKATPSSEVKHGNIIINESDETTHYSIIDKYGNSVSVTTTLNNSYGSKVFVEEGGFFLNNEMDDFSSKPGYPNFYGLIGSEANSIKAGKRMLSSMTPTIVLKDNKPSLIVGTPGGSTIITSVLQTILNVYEFDMNIQDAVNAPRFHHQWLPDVVIFEEGSLDKVKDSILKSKNYFVISLPIQMETGGMSPRSSIGAVDAIYVDEKGNVSTGADFRGDDYGEILK